MKNVRVALFCLFFISVGCGNEKQNPDPEVIDHPYKPVANVPSTQLIGAYYLRLETSLNRNFMPSIPAGGAPLVAVISLVEASQKSIKGKFELQSFKIVASEGIWEPTFLTDNTSGREFEIIRVSHDGPHLDPGRFVDVVSEFKLVETGEIYEILSAKQKIGRSD